MTTQTGAFEYRFSYPKARLRQPALAFSAAAMLIFFICLAVIPVHQVTGNGRFVSEVVRQYQYTGDNDQLAAHAITLLAIAIFSVLAFLLAQRGLLALSDRRLAWKPGALASTVFLILGLIIYSFWLPRWLIEDAVVLFALSATFIAAAPYISARSINLTVFSLIGAYIVILVLPGFLVKPISLMAGDPVSLSQFEMHLLYLTMPGHEIASGLNFFDPLPMGYGLLAPSIMSAIDRFTHSMTLGGQLRFVQACQLLFSVAAVGAYFSYRPRNPLGVLLAMLLAGPYWVTAGLGIWHPNQTGLRSIGLPLGVLALALAGRLPTRAAGAWLGAVAAILFLSNMETWVAVSAGFFIYLVVRTRNIPVKLALPALSSFVGVIVAYGLLYRIALGRLPISLHLQDFLELLNPILNAGVSDGLRLFDPGPDGENLYIVPFALIIFGHCIYVVVSSFIKLGARKLTQREAMRVAIATILLIWLSYYFRSPNWWQIWTHLFLYGFLIVDTMDLRLFGVGVIKRPVSVSARLRAMRIAPGRLAVLFFLGLMIVHTSQNLRYYTMDFMYPDWIRAPHTAGIVSDILLPKDMADALTAKAKRLVELNAESKGKLVYLTFNVSFMPELTGLFERDPECDLWIQIRGDRAFDGTIDKILDPRPELVLIDAPTGPLAVTGERHSFQERVRRAVGRIYRLSTTVDGWQVWRLIPKPNTDADAFSPLSGRSSVAK